MGHGGSRGSATAAAGTAKASTFVNVFTPNDDFGVYGASATSTASFNDYVYFTGPANSQINVTASFVVGGGITASAAGLPLFGSTAQSSFSVNVAAFGQGGGQSGNLSVHADGTRTLLGQTTGTPMLVSFVLNFDALGESPVGGVSVNAFLQSQGTARGGDFGGVFFPGEALSDAAFGSTVYWNGVVSATDSLGNPFDVSQLHAFSASGFDYMTSAVPEPSVVMFLLAGLGLLVTVNLRHGKRQTRS
jgi:hypothetical protein